MGIQMLALNAWPYDNVGMHIKSKKVRTLRFIDADLLILNTTSTYKMRNAFIPDFDGIVGISLLFAHTNHLSDLNAGGVRMVMMVNHDHAGRVRCVLVMMVKLVATL